MRANFGLLPGVRISVSFEWTALARRSAVERLEAEQAETLPGPVSWKDGYIFRTVAGQLVVDRLSESEAEELDSARLKQFPGLLHQIENRHSWRLP